MIPQNLSRNHHTPLSRKCQEKASIGHYGSPGIFMGRTPIILSDCCAAFGRRDSGDETSGYLAEGVEGNISTEKRGQLPQLMTYNFAIAWPGLPRKGRHEGIGTNGRA